MSLAESIFLDRVPFTLSYDYIIYTDGTNVFAFNTKTKQIEFINPDAYVVFQNVFNNLPNGGAIFVKKGTYTFSQKAIIKTPVSVIGEFAGISYFMTNGVIFESANPKQVILEINPTILQKSIDNLTIANIKFNGNTSPSQFTAITNQGIYDPYGLVTGSPDNNNVPVLYCYSTAQWAVTRLKLKNLTFINAQSGYQLAGINGTATGGDTNVNYYGPWDHKYEDLFYFTVCDVVRISGAIGLRFNNLTGHDHYSSVIALAVTSPTTSSEFKNVFAANQDIPVNGFLSNPDNALFVFRGSEIYVENSLHWGIVPLGFAVYYLEAGEQYSLHARNLSIMDPNYAYTSAIPSPLYIVAPDYHFVTVENFLLKRGSGGINYGLGAIWLNCGANATVQLRNFHFEAANISGAPSPGIFYQRGTTFPRIYLTDFYVDNAQALFYLPSFNISQMLNKVYAKNVKFSGFMTPTAITVGASPFVYQNQDFIEEDIIISGGSVSNIAWSRDGTTYYNLGLTAGKIRLEPGEYLQITYTTAPTMTKVPVWHTTKNL